MPGSLHWIIVLALGWEPLEEEKADFIYEILQGNPLPVSAEEFSYIPPQEITENSIYDIEQLITSTSALATFLRTDYFAEETQLIDYMKSNMEAVFIRHDYEVCSIPYQDPEQGIEGFIFLLFEIDAAGDNSSVPQNLPDKCSNKSDMPRRKRKFLIANLPLAL